jgi:hypothetical protein
VDAVPSQRVRQQHVSRPELPHPQQLELDPVVSAGEHRQAAAQYHRVQHQPVFIDQPGGGECPGQVGAAKNEQVFAEFLL